MSSSYGLLTLNINHRPFINITKPYMILYANKIKADFLLDDRLDSFIDTLGYIPAQRSNIQAYLQKCISIYHYLDKYDRIMFIDDTCMIHPHTPNLFQLCDSTMIGGFNESQLKDINSYEYDLNYIQNRKQITITHYLNTGILIVSKCHRYLFSPSMIEEHLDLFESKYPTQCYLNYLIGRDNVPIFSLEEKFHQQCLFNYKDNSNRNVKKLPSSYIIELIYSQFIFHITGYYKYRLFIIKQINEIFQLYKKNVTAVLLNYYRPYNLQNIILPTLIKNRWIDQIIISHGRSENVFSTPPIENRTSIIHLHDYIKVDTEYGLFRRYLASEKSKNNILLILDDDLIVSEVEFFKLLYQYSQSPNIIHGKYGRDIVSNNQQHYIYNSIDSKNIKCPILLTRIVMTHKDNIKYVISKFKKHHSFFQSLTPIWNGEDIFLSLLVADKNKEMNQICPLKIQNLNNTNAISKLDTHLLQRNLILKYLMSFLTLKL